MARMAYPGTEARHTRVERIPHRRIRLPTGFMAADATIETPRGPERAAALRAGSVVRSATGGTAIVRWSARLRNSSAEVAVVTLGEGVAIPERQLVLIGHPALARLCGAPRALVRAGDLGGSATGREVVARGPFLDHVCLVFDRPIVLLQNGLPVASFVPDDEGLAALPCALRGSLLGEMPELVYRAGRAAHWSVGPELSAADLARLA